MQGNSLKMQIIRPKLQILSQLFWGAGPNSLYFNLISQGRHTVLHSFSALHVTKCFHRL